MLLMGRVTTMKMEILAKVNYLFSIIPIKQSSTGFKSLDSYICYFSGKTNKVCSESMSQLLLLCWTSTSIFRILIICHCPFDIFYIFEWLFHFLLHSKLPHEDNKDTLNPEYVEVCYHTNFQFPLWCSSWNTPENERQIRMHQNCTKHRQIEASHSGITRNFLQYHPIKIKYEYIQYSTHQKFGHTFTVGKCVHCTVYIILCLLVYIILDV